jgi:hypothetical protein
MPISAHKHTCRQRAHFANDRSSACRGGRDGSGSCRFVRSPVSLRTGVVGELCRGGHDGSRAGTLLARGGRCDSIGATVVCLAAAR